MWITNAVVSQLLPPRPSNTTRNAEMLASLMWTGTAAAAPSRCSLTGRGNCYPLRSRPCCDSDAVCYTKTPGEAWAQCRTDQCSAVCGWECRALAVNGSVDGGTFRSGSQSGEEALAASAGRSSADATKTSPQQMPSSAVGRAVEQVLCRGQPSFSSVATNPGVNGVSGLTSQLNYVTQDVLDHLYRSEGLSAADSIHRTATLQGYGGGKFGEHFDHPRVQNVLLMGSRKFWPRRSSCCSNRATSWCRT